MSPKLLELSGVGDGALLQRLGIQVVHHSPLVGENMRDHITFSMPHRLVGAKGLNRRYRGIGRRPGPRHLPRGEEGTHDPRTVRGRRLQPQR